MLGMEKILKIYLKNRQPKLKSVKPVKPSEPIKIYDKGEIQND
jgi:hypothetical protein